MDDGAVRRKAKQVLLAFHDWPKYSSDFADNERQRALSDLVAALTEEKPCEWREDEDGMWETTCGESFQFTAGGPTSNGAEWCQYCGSRLAEVPHETILTAALSVDGRDG